MGWVIYALVLAPLNLHFFTTITFVILIASTVQMLDIVTRRFLPTLHAMWGIYLMLIATNCIVLSVPLINVDNNFSLFKSLVHSVGAGVGFSLALVLMAGIREEIEKTGDIPDLVRGTAMNLLVAGSLSLAFMGFAGLFSAG